MACGRPRARGTSRDRRFRPDFAGKRGEISAKVKRAAGRSGGTGRQHLRRLAKFSVATVDASGGVANYPPALALGGDKCQKRVPTADPGAGRASWANPFE